MTFFSDTFSDGIPPPSVPNPAFSGYTVQGDFTGGESGGKLRIGDNGYVPTLSAIGEPRLVNSATLQTNTDSANITNGLKKNFSFNVFGVFDLVALGDFDSYGLRLTDGGNDDVVDIRMAWSSSLNAPVVKFFRQDFILNTLTDIAEAPLNTSGFDQVVLALAHDAGSDQIKAGYMLASGGNYGGAFTEFVPTTTIFHDELWTRAGFRAVTVPEPATLALFGLGLAGLGFSRRRKA